MKEIVPDVLAERYASTAMLAIWSAGRKVILERELWLATLQAQRDLGLAVPDGAIEDYRAVIEIVDFASITTRELVTLQDVKARIEEFNALAGHQLIHQAFTSRDLTDNIEQLQIYRTLLLIRDRSVAVLYRLGRRAAEFQTLDICGRSHNVPGQVTTVGKRFANLAEDMLLAFGQLEYLVSTYPLRGIKGAMGTQQDMEDLLGGPEAAFALEERVRKHLGLPAVFDSVAQVYPRSLDFAVISTLTQLSSAPGNFAKMIRLMAGQELAHEGFKEGQTGSTGMPHKMNSRTSERINGLVHILAGFLQMTAGLLGDQWYEGDVSCSVVRRVALPGSCFALDGLYEATMTVLDDMELFPRMIEYELERYLPFLCTTRLLIAAVKTGMGRETAHRIIKQYAVAAVKEMREGKLNTFLECLSADESFPIRHAKMKQLLAHPNHGLAVGQVDKVCDKINVIMTRYPHAADYDPEPIR